MKKAIVCVVMSVCLAIVSVGTFAQTGHGAAEQARAAAEPVCTAPALRSVDEGTEKPNKPAAHTVDYANATYRIENENVTLSSGTRSVPVAPGSATQHMTRLSGHPWCGQLGKKTAAAVFIADDPGGSGSYFYVGVALAGGPATNAFFLGDRIKPQSIAFRDNGIVVTYLQRKPNDPMAAKPTLKKHLVLRFDAGRNQLIEPKSLAATREPDRSGD
jgi:hypothetical protein